ncbi:MAG: DUF309 domain-containing protein [Deltaproteobacteria bacterium]|nr:DUF309 domain-containing protein [Deltaproteobacteria bacterium]
MSRQTTLTEIPAPTPDRVQRYSARPFPSYRYVPGLLPHPLRDPAGHSYGVKIVQAQGGRRDDWLYGIDLFNAFFFWEAHEAWEGLWSAAAKDSAERSLFQGLIQIAAALLKIHVGVVDGARTLAHEGCAKLAQAAAERRVLFGLDILLVEQSFRRYFRGLDRSQLPRVDDAVPVLRLQSASVD